MIRITFFRNSFTQIIYGFTAEGHAGYEEEGKDIICAGVSALTITTANSIETLCRLQSESKQDDGYLFVEFPALKQNHVDFNDSSIIKADALMNAMMLGLGSIQAQYGKKYLSFCEKTEKDA